VFLIEILMSNLFLNYLVLDNLLIVLKIIKFCYFIDTRLLTT